ncbi:hypothetical protein Pmar_PMAR008688, partial [Perkinsus marinus ATCC 50983]
WVSSRIGRWSFFFGQLHSEEAEVRNLREDVRELEEQVNAKDEIIAELEKAKTRKGEKWHASRDDAENLRGEDLLVDLRGEASDSRDKGRISKEEIRRQKRYGWQTADDGHGATTSMYKKFEVSDKVLPGSSSTPLASDESFKSVVNEDMTSPDMLLCTTDSECSVESSDGEAAGKSRMRDHFRKLVSNSAKIHKAGDRKSRTSSSSSSPPSIAKTLRTNRSQKITLTSSGYSSQKDGFKIIIDSAFNEKMGLLVLLGSQQVYSGTIEQRSEKRIVLKNSLVEGSLAKIIRVEATQLRPDCLCRTYFNTLDVPSRSDEAASCD